MLRSALLLALSIALAGAGSPARAADTIRVEDLRFERSLADDAWMLWARFELPIDDRIDQALRDGVSLHYVVEFDLTRPRWWWWDAEVAAETRTWRLAYHALTRSYRLISDGVIEPFETLDEAVRALSRVRGWRVAPVTALSAPGSKRVS